MTNRRRPTRPRPARSEPFPSWVLLCFFASGAAGLLYEVVWAKQLSYLLGNSLQAVATVAAAFLGGLALGARFLGTALGARSEGVRAYAGLELAIAVLGVASLPILKCLDPVVGALYRSAGGEGAAFGALRVALLFVLLLPPSALMGATLPVLVACFERGRVGATMARLYAVNTLGAVAGTLTGGFFLLPTLGLSATTWVAAGLNLVAALTAWMARPRADQIIERTATPESDVAADALSGNARLAFALLFLLSGLAALAFQIVWVRLFTLVLGSSVYSFSAVLGLYLLGLALGSALVAPLLDRFASLRAFGLVQLVLAGAAAIQLPAFSRLPEWTYALTQSSGASWRRLFTGEVTLVAAFLLVPCALLGGGFPIATRLMQRRGAGHAAGLAYAVNTLGAIAGSLLAGFVAIPALGVQTTQVATLCLSAAIGAAAFALASVRREAAGREAGLAMATCLVIAALALRAPGWDPSLMSLGIFRPIEADKMSRVARIGGVETGIVRIAAQAERVLYYGEGINGSVMVATNMDEDERWLRVGGKVDAGTGKDMDTQVMLGMIPAACADSGARTLVIGLGAGFTVEAALAAGAGPTEVVELEPRVVEASRYFHTLGEHPLDDPRVRLFMGDARTHLAYGGGRYGMIVSEPSNPWIAGVNNLFTVDFYRLVRARLEPSGVFCQWVQLYELTPPTLSSMIATFLAVFPSGHAFTVGPDLLLVAAPPGGRLALERLRSNDARRALRDARVTQPEVLAGFYAGPLSALRAATAGAPLNRDDLPIVEYRAPRDLVNVGTTGLFAHPLAEVLVDFPETPPSGPILSAWSREGWFESRGRLFVEQDDLVRAEGTARAARDAGCVAVAQRLAADIETASRRRQALVESERARGLLDGGQEEEGLRVLLNAAALDSANARIWLWIADRKRLAGDLAGAEVNLTRGLRVTEDPQTRAEAAIIAGMLEVDRKRPLIAAARFREVQRWSPKRSEGYLFEAAARASGGDRAGARKVLRRGLIRLPGQTELTSLLATLQVP